VPGLKLWDFCGVVDYSPIKIQKMKANMGTVDQAIRIVVAIVITALYFTKVISGTAAITLLILAGIFILTSFISFCPLYYPFKISTQKKR
jgi:hypothetical protein